MIRFAEGILHVTYKSKLGKWQASGEWKKDVVGSEKK